LKYQERFGSGPDEVEKGDRKKDWFKVNGKARNTLQTVAVRIADNVTYALMEQVSMQGIPDGLIHNAKVFCIGEIGILATRQIKDEIGGEK
jgi:hypothetical protein